ncbi:polysaccharide lyase family 7 protein [Maribacter sp. SA7]|uniref:polysaccharide lyase family 7 protein n=1 Tax=Maribacter zhoushanensis TaxID=3030012 RepID=UPI0023EBA55A|nr:polysaccharide lyase family 7 protein [Maribacter zhoushanensis]MDF4204779.1 polysaccharide lyase family 7 protein [Maribacter zhoushanensis]
MQNTRKGILVFIVVLFLSVNATSQNQKSSVSESDVKLKKSKKKKKKVRLPEIDLNNWKVTIPEGSGKGGAISVAPPEILNYATNKVLKPYMYNDSTKGALTFYAYPTTATTANTKYSRSELREQMVTGDDNVNWTFKQGGTLKAKLSVDEISRDKNGKYHKVIILQIHGRLTNDQRDLIKQKDNNAPPVLKIYWQNGKIRVKTKKLKYSDVNALGILHEEAWTDDEGFNFEEEVGFGKFQIEVKVTDGKMVVSLNKTEYAVYDDFNMKRWGVFENYFKAGNYFQSRDEGSFAKVSFYELEVKH